MGSSNLLDWTPGASPFLPQTGMRWDGVMGFCGVVGRTAVSRSRGGNKLHTHRNREERLRDRAVLSLYIHLWEYRTLFTEWSSWRVTHNRVLVVLSNPSVFHHQRVQSGLVLQILSPTDTLTAFITEMGNQGKGISRAPRAVTDSRC